MTLPTLAVSGFQEEREEEIVEKKVENEGVSGQKNYYHYHYCRCDRENKVYCIVLYNLTIGLEERGIKGESGGKVVVVGRLIKI